MSNPIGWCDETWIVVDGCTPVSAGCANCYAKTMAGRRLPGGGFTDRDFGEVRCHPERLDQPLRWRKPRAIFVCSMGDLFHERVPFEFRAAVFGVMAASQQHTFLVLTKRPRRFLEWFKWVEKREVHGRRLFPDDDAEWRIWQMLFHYGVRVGARLPNHHGGPWPLPNVWLGVSVEDQKTADERIPLLLETPAAHRFVSVEPLLGPVNLKPWLHPVCGPVPGVGFQMRTQLAQVIVGGETGPGARPCNVEWIRSLVAQCCEAQVPCYIKQLGSTPVLEECNLLEWPEGVSVTGYGPGTGLGLMQLHRRSGADPAELPEDLRVRELAWR